MAHVHILLEQETIIHNNINRTTVLPAKSDSDVMFCLQSYQGLIIDRSLVYLSYPQDRINTQVIYRFALVKWILQVNVLFNNYKHTITHCHTWLVRQ